MEENKQQTPQFNGWKDVKIDANMPMQGLLEVLNIFNQRLILIEDQLTIKVGNGENSQIIPLSQYWAKIQEQEYQKMMEEYKKQMEAQQAQEQSQPEQPAETPSDVQ